MWVTDSLGLWGSGNNEAPYVGFRVLDPRFFWACEEIGGSWVLALGAVIGCAQEA